VIIPDWSRVQRRESQRRITPIDNEFGIDEDDGEEEDKEDERIPPHELIARQLARSQITSFSLFEGAGRTLKGREFPIKTRCLIMFLTYCHIYNQVIHSYINFPTQRAQLFGNITNQ